MTMKDEKDTHFVQKSKTWRKSTKEKAQNNCKKPGFSHFSVLICLISVGKTFQGRFWYAT